MKFFRKTTRITRPRSTNPSINQTKATIKHKTIKNSHSTSFIQTMLKLKNTPKGSSQDEAPTKPVRSQPLVNPCPIATTPVNIYPVPSTRHVKNTTGALLSKITKKFERWKSHTVQTLQTILTRKTKNGHIKNTKKCKQPCAT